MERIDRSSGPTACRRSRSLPRGLGGLLSYYYRRCGVTNDRGRVFGHYEVAALERVQHEKEVRGEFEGECPGYCGAQDTFYVGMLKGVGRIYQQTFIDTYCKVAFAKLYTEKTPVTAADLLNDRVLPFFAEHEVPLNRVLTDRGTEYCGVPDRGLVGNF